MKPHYIVDTNVLMRYLLKDDDKQYRASAQYFLSDHHVLVIPIHVLCEAVWLLTKKLKLKRSFVIDIVLSIVALDNVVVNDTLVNAGVEFMQQGGDFADGVIAYEVSQYDNASLLTFDKKAQAVAHALDISVLEPDSGAE